MPELLGSTLGYIIGVVLLIEVLFWPLLIAVAVISLLRSARRCAFALERMAQTPAIEKRIAPVPPPAPEDHLPQRIALSAFGR